MKVNTTDILKLLKPSLKEQSELCHKMRNYLHKNKAMLIKASETD